MKTIRCTGCNSEKIHKISSILHVIFEQKKYNENRNYYTELWKKRISLNSKYNILLIQNKYYHYRSNIFVFILFYIFCFFVLPVFTRIPFVIYLFDKLELADLVVKIELIVITLLFIVISILNLISYISAKKKYNSYYICEFCGNLFVPSKYRVILKKKTSIFVKLHLAYKKLMRKKFVNVRYVDDRTRKEMNRLGMK